MEVWTSSGTDEMESSSSQDEEDEEDEEWSSEHLCRELAQVLCSERVGQVTKTYHDIEAVTHLLAEKERDLELAARIGQSLLNQNKALNERNTLLDQQLEIATEEIAQLRHELTLREELLQLYASTEEREPAVEPQMRRNESSSSLSNYVHYDYLYQKLRKLEEENLKLRNAADELTLETSSYEEQEQHLMMVCVEELSLVNKQVAALSEELSRRVEESVRQQEEISSLLSQIVDLQQRSKVLIRENEELTQHVTASRENQSELRTELKDLRERHSECEDMLQEAREEVKNLRNRSVPSSTVQRYSSLAAAFPMDSLAAEIEGTFRKGLDSPASSEYRSHPYRVFETVKVANQAGRLHSPQVPGSSPASSRSSPSSTPHTSCYCSDSISLNLKDKACSETPPEQNLMEIKRLGQPGMPGGHDLEEALRSLFARQESHSSDRPFFEVERERKLRALGASSSAAGSSGFLTPNDSLVSTGTNYSGTSHHSSSSSHSYLPERLQIVKPLEGSVTLHHWQKLAKPDLGGILQPRPGILTKDFKELEVDIQHVYSLNDFEEDEPDWSKLPNQTLVNTSGPNFPHTCPTYTITNSQALHPSVLLSSFSTSLQNLPTSQNSENRGTTSYLQELSSNPCFLHRSIMNTSRNFSLIQLLDERASLSPAGPVLRSSVNNESSNRSHVGGSRRKNMFSFNLVEKLQNLGLYQVAARGIIGSGKTPPSRQRHNTDI